MGSQQFCLKWNNHQSNMLTVFEGLLSSAEFVDVTLVCEESKIQAHKMVLSACSPFFKDIFVTNPCKHPVIILKDMKYSELQAILEFMYKGEINVSQDKLSALLKSAESLKIKGLTEVTSEQHKSKPMEQNSLSDVNSILSNTSYESPADSQIKRKRRKRKSFENVVNNIKQENGDDQVTIMDSPQLDESYDVGHSQKTEELQNVNEVNNPDMIHKSESSVNDNSEYMMDPSSFMEQSLTTEREYMGSSNTNETSVSNSELLIPSNPENSNDANFSSDMMGFTSKLSDSSVNDDMSGMGLHYDTSGNENSDLGAYAKPVPMQSGSKQSPKTIDWRSVSVKEEGTLVNWNQCPNANSPNVVVRRRKASKHFQWSADNMQKAMHAVMVEGLGYNRAARMYSVPDRTLWLYVRKQKDRMSSVASCNTSMNQNQALLKTVFERK